MPEAGSPPSHRSLAERTFGRIELHGLTARRAALIIAGVTIVTAVAGGVLAWAVDREDFPTLGLALWWSLQTVTTVGYGDIVPSSTSGRVIGGVIMLAGIAFVTVVTAAVTATLIEAARRRRKRLDHDLHDQLAQIGARLAAIEQALGQRER
jgi:voltage-gated potassium channel